MRVYRCFVTKKAEYDSQSTHAYNELKNVLELSSLRGVKIFHRYDCEGLSEEIIAAAKALVFAKSATDELYDEDFPQIYLDRPHTVLAIEALPGQYDQRADSSAACIRLITGQEKPNVAYAKIFVLYGELEEVELEKISSWLINPVESRKAAIKKPTTLKLNAMPGTPSLHLTGFISLDQGGLSSLAEQYSLAMDIEDLVFLQRYFTDEGRDPTETELRVLDTYWSDHCRHTTFLTELKSIEIEDAAIKEAFEAYLALRGEVYGEEESERPVTLMDIATIGAKVLKKRGLLKNLDESEEVNACTVKVCADTNSGPQDWLLYFKNETHNHPTEMEPFGGAATCLGGAIRDPLSGRAYVHQAMRITGGGDPREKISDTIPGKLPQRRIAITAAAGYSSYGNQIGVPAGFVDEIYHDGYKAKRMELGAVVGAAPASNVVRKQPSPGDAVIVLGGRTGRDGLGGATGSSKIQTEDSLSTCSSQVQKGNAPEERKLLRLFRDPEVTVKIKRSNDFGAGGVSVAIGELARGLWINLDVLPVKYDGLSGTELAISESQERMAVVVSPEDVDFILDAALKEGVEATVVAHITSEENLVMEYKGEKIVDLRRAFLDSNGAKKVASCKVDAQTIPEIEFPHVCGGPAAQLAVLSADLNTCSKRGLGLMFDSSAGAYTVLAPYGGKYGRTPSQAMVSLLPSLDDGMNTCSAMAYGYNPFLSEINPFIGSAIAVTHSLAKLVAVGCSIKDAYLTFQEYFERLHTDPRRWGKPFSALLGALSAQMGYGVAAVGGKDSMSGSFEDLDVPPALISFAVATADAKTIISSEFKKAGSFVYLFAAPYGEDGLPIYNAIKKSWELYLDAVGREEVLSSFALSSGGISEAVMKMGFGNKIGFEYDEMVDIFELTRHNYGAILAESDMPLRGGVLLGKTTTEHTIKMKNCPDISLENLLALHEKTLSDIYPHEHDTKAVAPAINSVKHSTATPTKRLAPTATIPVFSGTSGEYETKRALKRAGGAAQAVIISDLTPECLAKSEAALIKALKTSQMLIIPGGMSGGGEPDGAAKLIASFFSRPALQEATLELLDKNSGLALGIGDGFHALLLLGLLPFGTFAPQSAASPMLVQNDIGLYRSKYVHTRIASTLSPWLSRCSLGEVHTLPFSHGEGKFVAPSSTLEQLAAGGQIALQYCDENGSPSMVSDHNPGGSLYAVEGITSPDGRVLGKMTHSERFGSYVALNVPGNKFQPIFEGGVDYFK